MPNDTPYEALLETKSRRFDGVGYAPTYTPDVLFPFQAAIVEWACRKGRAAIFADCGLGKTLMQLVWAENMRGDGSAIIVAPLGVVQQTIDEAKEKLGLKVEYMPDLPAWNPGGGLYITNYERIGKFFKCKPAAIVLDESSILKAIDGKTRTALIREFAGVPYRLCCTATPAPNDTTELGNHAEFLSVMTMKEMLATYFVNRQQTGTKWDMKAHGREHFYRWMASWAMFMRKPSDLGFSDDGFDLPPLDIKDIVVPSDFVPGGMLFPMMGKGICGRSEARQHTVDERVAACADMVNATGGVWVVWCGLNAEAEKLAAAVPGAVNVTGSDSQEKKIESYRRWRDGTHRVLVTKQSIFGFGMNFQFCNQMAFLGLGDSYEQYYQAIRRCWRFGQKRPVSAHVVLSDIERDVASNVHRKEREAIANAEKTIAAMRGYEQEELGMKPHATTEKLTTETGDGWSLTHGDCVKWLSTVDKASVDMSVFSPPFADLYAYTDDVRDIGNSRDWDEYFNHFGYMILGLLNATKPGRLACVHVAQIPSIKYVDGFIGLKDFRGRVVSEFVDRGWIYHGEVCIDKDPQAQAIRTKSKGLLFVSLKRDSSWLRPALADYVLFFRAPGENQVPVKPDDITHDDWISWARPIWYGISESDTLQFRNARSEDDTKHICPLQLPVIERCVRLWSNPGEMVLSPFAGIGSEGWVALRNGRKFMGCELKTDYFKAAKKNLMGAKAQLSMGL